MAKCGFEEAWVGPCDADSPCKEHQDLKCASCGSQATRSCDETGQFVCGAPLCDDCEHTTAADGTNGGIGFNAQPAPEGMKKHCKKNDQKYKPWYGRELS